MPPRLPSVQQGLRAFNLCLRPATPGANPAAPLPITQTASISYKEAKDRARFDPYGWALSQQRKNANLEKRKAIEQKKADNWGDPVTGIVTPFVESFDSAGQAGETTPELDATGKLVGEQHDLPTSKHMLNYFLTVDELNDHLEFARKLKEPVQKTVGYIDDLADDFQKSLKQHERNHQRASEAIKRIVSLDIAGGKMKKHVNISRCLAEFGRHNTEKTLKPKLKSIHKNPDPMPERCGPDTGSSEVQIALLTMKIRRLSEELGKNRGYKDKHNQRNVRLLVHRRQKLIAYLARKDKNSDRFNHMMTKLGLTPATWQGEITI